jgi:hypothetical protein
VPPLSVADWLCLLLSVAGVVHPFPACRPLARVSGMVTVLFALTEISPGGHIQT